MGLTRSLLKELGVEADAIERIMEAHGASMSAMVSKADRDDAIKLAVENAQAEWKKSQPKEVKPEETAEYKELLNKYSGLQTDLKLAEHKVISKYRDIVKNKIDPNDFDKSITAIKTEFAEFFEQEKKPEPEKEKPQTGTTKKPEFAGGTPQPEGEKSEEQKILEQFRSAFK